MPREDKHVLVAYDIKKNKIRNKVSELLKYFGLERFQYSVFFGYLEPKNVREMKKELDGFPLDNEDKIYIYTLCKRCYGQRVIIGKKPPKKRNMIFSEN